MNEELLKEKLLAGGASLVGFCKIDRSPIEGMPELCYAVSIACKLSDAVLATITEERPSIMYFQHYRAVNARLDQLALTAVFELEKLGFQAFPIAASQSTNDDKSAYRGVFPHKTAACLSGLGCIGKSGLLLTERYGSKVRFATVLTDMPLSREGERKDLSCGNCNVCRDACPAGAISGIEYKEGMRREEFFDAEKCSNNMKRYKDVGRGAVCGICIRVCPRNRLGKSKRDGSVTEAGE